MVNFSLKALALATLTFSIAAASRNKTSDLPIRTQEGLTERCTKLVYVKPGEFCANILINNNLRLEKFYAMNKGVGKECDTMDGDAWHCVSIKR
ncbi:hypothetical protein J1614_006646 [Plenodomus biglobosus]|nr:hypothetical protein J1614_006646 [Plenodomus biglobosus]